MKLIYRNGFIDLEAPVYMSKIQREKFISFMQEIFNDVEVVEKKEVSRRGPHGGEQRKWTVDDIAILLGEGSIKEKAKKLNRSEMGIIMTSGSVIPKLAKWMKERGYTSFPPSKKVIREFMKEVGML